MSGYKMVHYHWQENDVRDDRNPAGVRTRFPPTSRNKNTTNPLIVFVVRFYSFLVNAKSVDILLELVILSVVVYFSSLAFRALDGHRKICALPLAIDSSICSPCASLNLRVLDLRRPEYETLRNTSKSMSELGKGLRLDASESSRVKLELDLAHAKGTIELPTAMYISEKLGELELDLRFAAAGVWNVSPGLSRLLHNLHYNQLGLVKHIELADSNAKDSLISRITFGNFVPGYFTDFIAMFEQTQKITHASLSNAITLIKRVTSHLILCQTDVKTLAHVIVERPAQAREVGAYAYATWINSAEVYLDEMETKVKDALVDVEIARAILEEILHEVEGNKCCEGAVGPHMPMDVQLAIAKDRTVLRFE